MKELTDVIINDLYQDYKRFEKVLLKHDHSSEYVDLRHIPFIRPTTLLPISFFMDEIGIIQYIPNENTKNYLRRVFKIKENKSSTIPIKPLPKYINDQNKFEIIEEVRNLLKTDINAETFDYLASEAINNISEHSKYTNANMFAQKYPKKGFTDVCFMDNGISIPKSLENSDYFYDDDSDSIFEALNGKSSDINKYRLRGSGLNSTVRLVSEAFDGEMLIASRRGLVHINSKRIMLEELNGYDISGTLVSLRIREQKEKANIIEYSRHKELKKQ